MNKRIEETILGGNASTNSAKEGEDQSSSDYRILPKHMYGVSCPLFLILCCLYITILMHRDQKD